MSFAKNVGLRAYAIFERVIVLAMLVLLMVTVLWGTGMIAWEVGSRLVARASGGAPVALGELTEFFDRFRLLHEVFGAFLLILIGVELMKTVVMYLDHHELHVEVVFTVAMIAIARHAISLNLLATPPLTLLGMAGLIVALALGYYYYRKSFGLAGAVERSVGRE